MIVKGIVIKGRSLGRTLGFPTANIALPSDTDIENGVYLSRVTLRGESYRAISNVGVKPTVGSAIKGLECHLLDFEGDLYGLEIEVELLLKLRDEIKFESVEALRAQVASDIDKVRNLK